MKLVKEARILEEHVNHACQLEGLSIHQIAYRTSLLMEVQKLKEQMQLLSHRLQAIVPENCEEVGKSNGPGED